ncbi:MAG: cysteine desulfurase [Acidobacteria bacterium]|nr:cysteine desulfurase [Acidobacteriota bacterium]
MSDSSNYTNARAADTPIYLDYNATTPVDARVFARMAPYFTAAFGNAASRDHAFGWDAAAAVDEARYHVASLINARPGEIVFTSCSTESINLALKGVARGGAGRAVVTSVVEHEAVLSACRQVEADVEVSYLGVDGAGRLDLGELAESVGSKATRLVALMFANNEIGNVNPIRQASKIAHDAGALLFTDATQAVGKVPVDVRADGVDLAAFSAHKIYGPKGVGALFIRGGASGTKLEPLIAGGGQERGVRGGTLNVPGIVGFGEACRIARLEMGEESERVGRLRDGLEEVLLKELPDVHVNGDRGGRLPNTSNITFDGVDARSLIRHMKDVAVSTGSACSTGSADPSHVLKALGLNNEQAYSSVRFSLGRFTTEAEIEHAVERVVSSVRKLRDAPRSG